MSDLAGEQPERPTLDTAEAIRPFAIVFAVAAAMWAVELVDLVPGTDLDQWGIRPRQLVGLVGIATAPFLHADLAHLLGNTVPFLALGCVIAASGLQRFVQVIVITAVVAGVGTWLIGPSHTDHIGASGLVFGFLGYLVARGIFARHLGLIAVGIAVLFFYGSILWGLLPAPGISWQGHLFGLLGGVLAAWVIHGRRPAAGPSAQ